jgi:hypothetical protein
MQLCSLASTIAATAASPTCNFHSRADQLVQQRHVKLLVHRHVRLFELNDQRVAVQAVTSIAVLMAASTIIIQNANPVTFCIAGGVLTQAPQDDLLALVCKPGTTKDNKKQ